ncbi:hypothetical protein FK535_07570 [Mycolicibacterium sp. 018/SC-01/001]|nr:hypothetical protein FK535_07570 [Mycolicibacterium sp. 018/SC-01/001]
MSVTVSTVEASDPRGVIAAADQLGGHIADLDAVVDHEQQSLARVRAAWRAPGGDAAVSTGEQDIAAQLQLRARLESVRLALVTGGAQLDAIRVGLVELVTALRGMGWTVTDDGFAVAPFFPPVLKNFEPGFTVVIQRLLGLFGQVDGVTSEAIDGAVEP